MTIKIDDKEKVKVEEENKNNDSSNNDDESLNELKENKLKDVADGGGGGRYIEVY